MELRTTTKTTLGEGHSLKQAKVEHSVKKTYKGSKLVRVNNIVESCQAGAIDNKIKWAKHREQRKRERKMRQEPI